MLDLVNFLLSFALLMVSVTIHEFAHGFVAYRSGDPTAKYFGRLTLNPLAHIDPFWTIALPLFLFISTQGRFVFGAAKPVPVNFMALKNPKRDMVLVGAAGPAANFIFAVFLGIIYKVLMSFGINSSIVVTLVSINVFLGLFNLVPVPPLDGSRIVMGLLPSGLSRRYAYIEPFGFLIVMALLWLGILDRFLWPLAESLIKLVLTLG